MKYILLFVIASVFAGDVKVKMCGSPNDHFQNVNIAVNPSSLSAGDKFVVTVSGYLDEEITGGSADIHVSLDGIHIMSDNKKICEQVTCPVSSGDKTFTKSATVPGFVLPGHYDAKAVITDQNGEEISCIIIGIDF